MNARIISFIAMAALATPANAASREGVPAYYSGYTQTAANTYVGNQSSKPVVGQRTYTYQTPAATTANQYAGGMTVNGIAPINLPDWQLTFDYGREFTNFEFETGVRSRLKWDDMVLNTLTVGALSNFNVRNYDLFAYAEYSYGKVSHGAMSMDYDLKSYYESDPNFGIFTISVGDLSGKTDRMRFGFGAKNVWDLGGWKFSPSIGYEIFHHDLEMSDHYYPNPAIYLPLLTQDGQYVYGKPNSDGSTEFKPVTQGGDPGEGWYQVCLSPEDIKVAINNGGTITTQPNADGGTSIVTDNYQDVWGNLPWGVGPGECVIIGGDGPILVSGTTHIYNTTWKGLYIGLELEKQMTTNDRLRFYAQFGMPDYNSEGIWPNRTDWQQHPSFIDSGSNGAYSYLFEMEYDYNLSERVALFIKANANLLHVGKIPGHLYVAETVDYKRDDAGQYVRDDYGNPILEIIPAHTEYISDSLKSAVWQTFGLHIGMKYAF